MKGKVAKTYLKIGDLAKFVGRPYPTVRTWVNAGRILSKQRKTAKSVIHRIPVKEAQRVKRLIESGEWGVE